MIDIRQGRVPTKFVRPLVIAHVAATLFMVGLIWTIHVVHYPLFADVGASTYVDYQSAHVDRIGLLLALPWLLEGLTLLGVLILAVERRELRIPALVGAIAMAAVLVISGFWSAPAHGELADGFDAAVHDRLMTANLVRTLAWSICGASSVWVLNRVWVRETESHRRV
jgi:hypothetical protein